MGISKEKLDLNRKLNNGEIDEETYVKKMEKLDKRKSKQKIKIDSKKLLILVILMLIIFAVLIIITIPKKEYLEVENLNYFEDPVQIDTSGSTTKFINETAVSLIYVAEYTITGRVVKTMNYTFFGLGGVDELLRPVDVGIAWGTLADSESDKYINWSLSGRYLSWHSNNVNLLGGTGYISSHSSNNHLIASDDNIESLMKMIRRGDYVQIEGYLVNARWVKNSARYGFDTSTSRADTGDGACEEIYVTNIKWLKEK